MCGICGKQHFDRNAPVDPSLIRDMLGTIRHRGPDDEGVYSGSHVALGHRRLSIIDLSTGHQPLCNEDGTVWIVFNGEIYNYRELRTLLLSKGHVLKSQTDTEVIVHLYEELGPECLKQLRGMFAFAIWDTRQHALFLARDRVGIKPLYYCQTGESLVFASEIKAILADPTVERALSPEIIDRFLTFFYTPGDETMFKAIRKLAPGHYLLSKDGRVETRQYWDLSFAKASRPRTAADARDELVSLLAETVSQHMIADVPVGVLLSGGVDSTGVLSFAAQTREQALSTYTVGFAGAGVVDERPYAKLAAKTFGTQHYETTISAADFAAFMPDYVRHMEEPVCEPPAVALYFVSKLARNHVKVLLSGEGGDEAFAGYSNYRNILWLERAKRAFPLLTGVAGKGMGLANLLLTAPRLSKYAPLMKAPFPGYYFSRTSTPYLNGNGMSALYSGDFAGSLNRQDALAPIQRLHDHVRGQETLDGMLYIDTKTWLPDDLLIKADKITMANSIELRVPLLDHKILEFAAALPSEFKVHGFRTKYILKQALRSRVPKAILTRRKAGFPVPYGRWIRSELRSWSRDILLSPVSLNRGYFDRGRLEELLSATDAGGQTAKEVFSLVALELWHRVFA